jgi:regulator of replication initiation timing
MGLIADLLKEIPSAARYKAELEELAAEHDALKTQNAELRSQLAAAQRDCERIKEQFEKRATQNDDLPENESAVLQLVAAQPGHNHHGIAQEMGVGEEVAMFYLEGLRRRGVVERRGRAEHRWEFHPTQEGRCYLANRGLLQ